MSDHSSPDLIARLQNYGLFTDVSISCTYALSQELQPVQLAQGNWLFRQDDPGDSMYILDEGQLHVILRTVDGAETIIDQLEPGAVIGEMALLSGRQRSAGVLAITDCKLIQLSQAGYENLVAGYPELEQSVIDLALPRFRLAQMVGVLRSFFGDLDPATLQELQEQMTWRHISGGDVLFKQGDPGDSMAVVINGRLRIVVTRPDGEIDVTSEIGRGQTVGEFSLLTGEPRSASVYAVRDSDLLLLSHDAFLQITNRHPRITLQMARNIASRVAKQSRAAADQSLSAFSIAVVAISESINSHAFSIHLAEELEKIGSTLHFNPDLFDTHFGKKGAAQTAMDDPINIPILGWLSELEENHRFIVYQAQREYTSWTQRCLRQADRIVLVVDPKASPDITPIEAKIAAEHPLARIELVFQHEQSLAHPTGTSAWLARRQVHQHLHLRENKRVDFRRFIRRLIGRPVGLVLSGGGARGFAHAGVYRAIEEAGLEVDIIGGTSMGALVGALIAFGIDYDEQLKLANRFASRKMLLDYTFPAASIFETKKITNLLHELFGDTCIDDLFRPYFCVSSNLTKMRPFVHNVGPLWQAVRASIAIPGIFAPVNHQGDLLVDGGVMNNMPVDIMRIACENGPVIAVDVSPLKEKSQEWDFESYISGWQVMAHKLNPFAEELRVPSLSTTIMQSVAINSTYRMQQARIEADLLIQLDTSGTSILEWEAYEEMVNLGYETTRPLIENWMQKE